MSERNLNFKFLAKGLASKLTKAELTELVVAFSEDINGDILFFLKEENATKADDDCICATESKPWRKTMSKLNREEWERLEEIRNEMNDLLEQAEYLVHKSGQKFELERARAYWIAGMENYLGEGALSSRLSGCSMEDTIKALEPRV